MLSRRVEIWHSIEFPRQYLTNEPIPREDRGKQSAPLVILDADGSWDEKFRASILLDLLDARSS
jgi:hypothetical protein